MLQVTRGPSLLIDLFNALYVPGKVFTPANSQRGILLTCKPKGRPLWRLAVQHPWCGKAPRTLRGVCKTLVALSGGLLFIRFQGHFSRRKNYTSARQISQVVAQQFNKQE